MFKSLRLKLTLINIAVVGLIILVVFSGIYIVMRKEADMQTERMMRSVPFSDRMRPRKSGIKFNNFNNNNFYVKHSKEGTLEYKSNDPDIGILDMQKYYKIADSNKEMKGHVTINGTSYKYIKTASPFKDHFIIFMSTEIDNNVLDRLLLSLAIIGFATLGLVFVSSLFLADKALIPIKAAWEKQKNFIADASHELRTPLAIIMTSLELVMDNKDETVESQMKWLENIQSENKRMTDLVNQLIFLARTDSNQEKLERKPFYIDEALGVTVASLELMAEKKNIEIHSSLPENITFSGDEGRIRQLFVILIDNAIKYTPDGGEINVSLEVNSSELIIKVKDTGEGIPQEHLDKLFERFYRVDKARSRENGGVGLGLAIAHWIVKAHDGSIDVKSTEGKGSTFIITFPRG